MYVAGEDVLFAASLASSDSHLLLMLYVNGGQTAAYEPHAARRHVLCFFFWISYVQAAAQTKVLCGPVYVFAVVKACYILTTCPSFDNLGFDIFVAGGPQCHVITSVTIAGSIRTLSGY